MNITECKQCGGLMDQGESVCPACGLVQGTLQESHDKGISLSIGIRVYVSPMQDKISRLNKEATQLRADGNINAAIDNLKQVQVLMLDEPHYGIEAWLRLPKYLQTAGRFDEALHAIEQLVWYAIHDKISPIPASSVRNTVLAVESSMHRMLADIYKTKLLICKREKRLELVADCEENVRYHDSERTRLAPLLEQEDKERLAKIQARREASKRNRRL